MAIVSESHAEVVARKDDRLAWLRARKSGLGSSDAAAVLGLSPFRHGIDVYYEKVSPQIEDKPNWRMILGRELEDPIARLYTYKSGIELIDTGEMYRSKRWPFAIATPDRFTPDGRLVEIKASYSPLKWGQQNTDEIPEAYIVQVQHQMAVTGAEEAIVVVLINGEDLREYFVKRDDELIAAMMKQLEEFWGFVERREPPAIWDEMKTRSAAEAILSLNPPEPGKIIPMDAELKNLCEEYGRVMAELRALNEQKEQLRKEIAERIGDAQQAVSEDGYKVIRKVVSRGQYVVRPTTYQTLQVVVPKTEEVRDG